MIQHSKYADHYTPGSRPGASGGRDYALAQEPDGSMLLHTATCPLARQRAAEGRPVLTLLDCALEPPENLKRHACLDPT